MSQITVSALYTYPIKSCGRIEHDEITLDMRGPVYDRRWMVVRDATDKASVMVTARELPRLLHVQPRFVGDELAVTAPGMDELRLPLVQQRPADREVAVWGDTCQAVDEGDASARWFSEYLGTPLRLARMSEDADRPVDPNYARAEAQVSFADGYPLLLAQQESLDDLNTRLSQRGQPVVPMSRFRPNVVLSGSGEAWAEDSWQQVRIGEVPFDVVKPCARCVLTTIDPGTATAPNPHEPLATLATFRKGAGGGVMFGQNAIHRALGSVRVGDEVVVDVHSP